MIVTCAQSDNPTLSLSPDHSTEAEGKKVLVMFQTTRMSSLSKEYKTIIEFNFYLLFAK